MISTREMRALELNSEYYGVSILQLMENAGRAIAAEVALRFNPEEDRIAVFCGTGGNGGDGFVAARHLISLGFKVDVILAGKSTDIHHKEARRNWIALQTLEGISLHEVHDSTLIPKVKAEIVIDAMLGIGLRHDLRPPILQLVEEINKMDCFRLSIDVPTGVSSDSGEVLGDAVRADMTVTLHRKKPGLIKASQYSGDVVVRSIGLPEDFERFAGPGDVFLIAKSRPSEAHKGDFGRLLVIGGSEVYSGAPALVALAALRTGVDITYIASPEKTAQSISAISPSLITVKLKGKHLNPSNIPVIREYIERSTAVVMGPGLGLHEETRKVVETVIGMIEEEKIPLLLDADGLKAFAEYKRKIHCPLVLTPHKAEFQILMGKNLSKDLVKQLSRVMETARALDAVVLLKGHIDAISEGNRFKLNFSGNPGMTVGGTGDILSGIVGAFLAQGIDPFEAAVAGAFINGAAGDFVKAEKGYHMVPTDLLDWIPHVIEDPMSHIEVRENTPQRNNSHHLSRKAM